MYDTYGTKTKEGRDHFVLSLESCRETNGTYFKDNVRILGEDKLLVLSVCISGQDEQRYLVISRLKERVAL